MSKHETFLDPIKEARAVASLRESLAAMGAADDAEVVESTIEGETSLYEAIDLMLDRIRNAQVMTEGLKAVIAGLTARADRYERTIESHRTLIEQALMIAEIDTKIERPTATIGLSTRAPKVEIQTESDIPSEFWKTAAPTLDKKALFAALKDGRDVPGACLSNAAPTLTIRTK